jgi:CRISPR/Cas system-associated exonuclease Cas4 (RecB family)
MDRPVQESPVAGLRQSFLDSPFASLEPVKVEPPFQLVVDGRLVRGRIDAVYEREGFTELVDFKTGGRPEEGDGGAAMQLDLYALAAVDTWGLDPARVRTTYCWLRADGGAELDTKDWTADAITSVRARLHDDLGAVAARRFDETPGPWCSRCDFLAFCPAGQRVVG